MDIPIPPPRPAEPPRVRSLLSPDSRLLQLPGDTLYILVRPPHPFRILRLRPCNLGLSLGKGRAHGPVRCTHGPPAFRAPVDRQDRTAIDLAISSQSTPSRTHVTAALQAGAAETGLTTPAEHNDAAPAARRHSLGPQYERRTAAVIIRAAKMVAHTTYRLAIRFTSGRRGTLS